MCDEKQKRGKRIPEYGFDFCRPLANNFDCHVGSHFAEKKSRAA